MQNENGIVNPLPATGGSDASANLIIGSEVVDVNLGGPSGSDGNDIIVGLGGNDTMFGGAGNDLLLGGNENDTLTGGAGVDVLSGGRGADTFRFGASYTGAANADSIIDYSFVEGDALDISVRIPTKPAMHSNRKPATYSNMKPARLPI